MKIKRKEDKTLNHHEIQIVYHPKNKKDIGLLLSCLKKGLEEIEVFDEEYNYYSISVISIYYIETIDHKVFVYTRDDVYRINQHVKKLKDILEEFGFFQINTRTLVNKNHVIHYQIKENSRRILTLDNGEQLVVNRHYKDSLLMHVVNNQ